MEKKEKNDLDAFIPSYYLMDDAHLSGNDNYTFSRASSHESSSDMGMVNGQERIYNNQKYNVINNDVSSSSKVKIKRTLTASNNNRTTTTSHEEESSHRVSHSNDAVNGNDHNNEMEMKPIKEDKKSGLIAHEREPPKNTNQCLRCVIL